MSPPVFLDTNIPIYAAGGTHVLKEPCARLLILAAQRSEWFVTDAEVLQELLHRYLALRQWVQGSVVFRDFADLMRGRTESVLSSDVESAALLANERAGLSARDLVHAAVMERCGIQHIVTADRGFDDLQDIQRLDPGEIESWQDNVLV